MTTPNTAFESDEICGTESIAIHAGILLQVGVLPDKIMLNAGLSHKPAPIFHVKSAVHFMLSNSIHTKEYQ